MSHITCAVPGCLIKMKDRINGSHLKRKHDLSIDQYKQLYPYANLGEYKASVFICKVCNEMISGVSSIVKKHINLHGYNSMHEYNIEHEKKYCNCGCNKLTKYNYKTYGFNNYIDGHAAPWNKGLTAETNEIIRNSASGGWNKGLTAETSKIIQDYTEKLKYTISKRSDERKKEIVNKQKDTMRYKYGVDNPNDLMNGVKYKSYTMPSGKVIRIQGYEHLALDLLLNKFHEHEFEVSRKKLPKFKYCENKSYTPDILVRDIVYEVKSTWTYKLFNDEKLKAEHILSLGYKYIILIFDDKKKLVKEISYN